MNYDVENILLRYEIRSRHSDEPRLQLLILKHGNALFYRTDKSRRSPEGPDIFILLSNKVMDAVLQILAEERLYHLGSIEKPAEFWGGTHIYDFYFAGGGHTAAYYGVDLEYIIGDKDCPNVNYLFEVLGHLGEILIPEGVPSECFAAGEKALAAPVSATRNCTEKIFPVFDFQKAENERTLGQPERQERLERYAFTKRRDGTFTLEIQVGWQGGTGHRDGAGSSFSLPEEWFDGSYEQFLDKLTEHYPAREYGFGREELACFPGLQAFLGFRETD